MEDRQGKRAEASQAVPNPHLTLERSEQQLRIQMDPGKKHLDDPDAVVGASPSYPLLDTALPELVDSKPRSSPCCLQACRSSARQERPRAISRANRHIYKVCAMFAQPLGLTAQPTCKLSPSPFTEPIRHGCGHLSPEVVG